MELIMPSLLPAGNETSQENPELLTRRYKKRVLCIFFSSIIIIMFLQVCISLLSKVEVGTLNNFLRLLMDNSSTEFLQKYTIPITKL